MRFGTSSSRADSSLRRGKADDTLLVLELVREGLLAAEGGTAPPIGAMWAVEDDSKTEIAAGSLLAPGGVGGVDEETTYVTTGTLLGPGAGEVVPIQAALDEDHDDGDRGDDKGHHSEDDDHGDRQHKKHKKHKSDSRKKHDKKHKSKKHRKHDRDDD